jgi:hypothetical protein
MKNKTLSINRRKNIKEEKSNVKLMKMLKSSLIKKDDLFFIIILRTCLNFHPIHEVDRSRFDAF